MFLLCLIQLLNLLYLRDNTQGYLVPEVQPSGNNMLSGIISIIRLKTTLLFPEAKPSACYNIYYYYFNAANVLNHRLIIKESLNNYNK